MSRDNKSRKNPLGKNKKGLEISIDTSKLGI